MNALIKELAEARKIESEYKAALAEMDAEIKALIKERYGQRAEHLSAMYESAKTEAADAEFHVRQAALEPYGQDGNKHPHDAITIKVYTKLVYYPSDAFAYCVKHLPTALKMDKRRFEKVAKAAELDFVDFVDEPRATITRDLSAYLVE